MDDNKTNDHDQAEQRPGDATVNSDTNLDNIGLEDETSAESVGHGEKVIEPSAEFENEMTGEVQQAETDSVNPSDNTADTAPDSEMPVEPADAGAKDTENPPTTPAAVRDFINSEENGSTESVDPPADSGGEPADSSVSPSPGSDSSDAGETASVSTPAGSTMPATDSNLHPVTGQPLVPDQPPKKSKKLLLFSSLIAAVIVILLVATYVFAVYLPNKPDNVLKAALSNSLALKNVKFDGSAEITPKGDASGPSELNLTTGGVLSNDGKFKANLTLDATVTKLKLDLESPNGKDAYIRLSGLDGIPQLLQSFGASNEGVMLGQMGSLLKQINGQWYELDQSLLQKMGVSLDQLQLSKDDQSKVKQAYLDHSFLVIKKVLPEQQVGGVDSFHFEVVVSKQQLLAFVDQVKSDNLSGLKISQSMVEGLAKLKDSSFASHPFDVWISKDSKQFDQLAFSYADDTGSAKVKLNFSDYNQAVNVSTPKDAKSVMQLLSQLMPMFMGGMPGDGMSSLGNADSMQGESQKAEVQTILAQAKMELAAYYADTAGQYPKDKSTFIAWLNSAQGGNSGVFATSLSSKFTYKASPSGCDNVAKKCVGFSLTADKSIWGGTADLKVTN